MSETILDIDQIEEIINSASLEDVTILNEHYQQILDRLPNSAEDTRYVVLRNKTEQRIRSLIK